MAPNHVPTDHLPFQGQNMFSDPNYDSFLQSMDQYGTQPWNSAHLNNQPVSHPVNSPAAPAWPNSFPQQAYGALNQPYQTPSPYQYGQFSNAGPVPSYGQASAVDPSLVDPSSLRQQQQSPYQMPARNPTPNGQSQTVAPQALQHGVSSASNPPKAASPFQMPKTTTEMFSQRTTPAYAAPPVRNPNYEVVSGKVAGGFTFIDQSALAKSNQTSALNKLVTFGSQPLSLGTNRTVLPQYNARQSINDLKKTGTKDKRVVDKLAKKSFARSSSSRHSLAKFNTALKRDVSSSEYSSSSDDSDDSDDYEESPLPAVRPEEPKGAVRYDAIKATWAPRMSSLGVTKTRNGLKAIWNDVLDPIQKRWRADSLQLKEATDKQKTSELPTLKSRVKDQRDLLEVALKTLLEHGHPDVLYHLAQVKPFLYCCYQFLANRFKMNDFNGALPTVIYEVLLQCGTLTTELLEDTKVKKALVSMRKNANERSKGFIQKIIDAAAANTKKSSVSTPPKDEPKESEEPKRTAGLPTSRPAGDPSAAKKARPSVPAQTVVKKIPAAAPSVKSTPSLTSTTASQKRPGEKAAPVPVRKGNQVVNKPSSLFSTLNAASKKPAPSTNTTVGSKATAALTKIGPATAKKPTPAASSKPSFSFAETMKSLIDPKPETTVAPKPEKQLPPETPEEKVKRLRKESRRHLRVTFRPDASLVDVRYFHHDPDEELGHDENFVRDAGDIGGEGRMFKQHRDMEMDDDEDEPEVEYRPWVEPSEIDFSRVDAGERARNYAPYGGGQLQPTSPEKAANQQRENATLLVVYTHPSDVPSSPREPLTSTEPKSTATEFGPPPQYILDRLPKAAAPAPSNDFSALFETFKKHSTATAAPVQASLAPTAYVPPAPPLPTVPNLSSIMSALQAIQPQQPVQPAQPPPVDLAALLSSLQTASAQGVSIPPPPTGWPPVFPQGFGQAQQAAAPSYQAQQAQQTQQQQQGQNNNGHAGAKRQRNDDDNHSGYGSFKKGKFRNTPNGQVPHKVIPCKFFKQGKCTKGDDCTFIHE
ncbi:hypothetical protein EJ04DRAFT_135582 [Polyplosphaeria fusca]|uniref:C3H1-type domain-containing protein n=1 Tax=Polyplosphaeria fusca TaxID=682080 RepID=A0A9P4R0Q3_9PLEO|nr:hypothetical protein EJ04DRAFT_135582 [Polyplosphaeria fusca]